MLKEIFVYMPFAVAILAFVGYALQPPRLKTKSQAIALMIILLCASKFLCFRSFGGDAFNPELPSALIIAWNMLYSSLFILFALTVIWSPFCWAFNRRITPQIALIMRIILPILAVTVAVIGIYNGVKNPVVRQIEISDVQLPESLDGFTIAQLSDIHVSSAARRPRTAAIVEITNSLEPDLILVTGDIVDGEIRHRRRDVEPLKDLRAKYGVYGCSGNHEIYGDWFHWQPIMENWGIHFLENECVFPVPELALGGLDDNKCALCLPEGTPVESFKVFRAATNGEYRVYMQHRPRCANANALAGVRLQLSGHTHGGIAPIFMPLIAWFNGGFVRGHYDLPGGASLYVSPGTGQWAGFPIRLFNDAEITLITLRKAKKGKK